MSANYLERFVQTLPGWMFCHTCLARMLAMNMSEVRDAIARLGLVEG